MLVKFINAVVKKIIVKKLDKRIFMLYICSVDSNWWYAFLFFFRVIVILFGLAGVINTGYELLTLRSDSF